MKVVDVHNISVYNVKGVSLRRRFCVYVRILTQSMRTSFVHGKDEVIVFDERFRFRYDDVGHLEVNKPKLYAELWYKGLVNEKCVAITWVDLAELHFTRGETIALHLSGHFDSRSACIDLAVTAVNFPSLTAAPSSVPQSEQPHTAQPVMGIPLVDPNSAHTEQVAQYTPNPVPIVADTNATACNGSGGEHAVCQPGPLPSPRPFDTLDLPPPNYPPEFYQED